MRLRNDAHLPAVFVDQVGDHPRCCVGLAASRGAVHSEIGAVKVKNRGGDVINVVRTARQCLGRMGVRWSSGEDIDVAGLGQLRECSSDLGGDCVDRVPRPLRIERLWRCQSERQLGMRLVAIPNGQFVDDDLSRR